MVCVTLDPALEDQINAYIDRGAAGTTVNMPSRVASRIADRVISALQAVINAGHPPVVIASPPVRAVVKQLLDPHLPTVAVLGYNEVVSGVEVESMALVSPPADERAPVGAAA
jgi:flagellar biosynthesis protein FlhA